MDTLNLKPYGQTPTHRTTPKFNVLLPFDDIAAYYLEHTQVDEFCLLNSDKLTAATAYTYFKELLFGITNGGKLDVLIPDTVRNLALDTDMQTGAGTYGTNYGKLIFTYS